MEAKVKLPEEFRQRIEKQLGDEAPLFFRSMEEEPHRAIRINPLKGPDPSLILSILGIDPSDQVPWEPLGYEYKEELSPGKHPLHAAGAYYIQEPSAMLPVSMLNPKGEDRVLDLCAAPGGKTTQIAARMGNKGVLFSNEIHPARAKILSENVERMGLKNCIVTNEKPENLAKFFPNFFTKILVDAPCSGEGMFRKNYIAIEEWEKEPNRNFICQIRQKEVLEQAGQMLQVGGILCYSTCTFAEEENEIVIQDFLSRHPDFHIHDIRRIWPHKNPGEGHYSCLLIRDKTNFDGEFSSSKLPKLRQHLSKISPAEGVVNDFLSSLLKDPKSLMAPLLNYGDIFYLPPDGTPDLRGLKVLRPGLCLGSVSSESKKGRRFTPNHALALSLSPQEVKNASQLSLEDARRYLHGEALPCEGAAGWTLVHYEGFSLGFGKVSNGLLKNHYPKGLRI